MLLLSVLVSLSVLCTPVLSWSCSEDIYWYLADGPFTLPANNSNSPYAANMTCYWTIQVSRGMFATMEMSAFFRRSDEFLIFWGQNSMHAYSNSLVGADIPQKFSGTLFFPAGRLDIQLRSHKEYSSVNGYLSFSIRQTNIPKLPTILYTMDYYAHPFHKILPLSTFAMHTVVFSSAAFEQYTYRLVVNDQNINYDGCFIYSGSDPSIGEYKAPVGEQWEGTPTLFIGTTSVICFTSNFPQAYLLATPSMLSTKINWSVRLGGDIPCYQLSSYGGYKTYLTTYCPDGCRENLVEVTRSEQNTSLQLYCGTATQSTYLTSFAASASNMNLPQQMCSTWNTYAVEARNGSSVSAFLTISRSSDNWNKTFSGRKGVVVSSNYGFTLPPSNQSSETSFNSDGGLYNFYANHLDYNVNSTATFTVTIFNRDEIVLNMSLPQNDIQTVQAYGTSMKVKYEPQPDGSYGSALRFGMDKGTSNGFIILPLILLLCGFLL